MATSHGQLRLLSSKEEWAPYQAEISHLYLGENRNLKQVMAHMELYYRVKATVKMYKNKITDWGLDKKNKRAEVEAILRKKTQRDGVRKASAFTLRGRAVSLEAVKRYAKRNGITIADIQALVDQNPATPPDLSCWTPPQLPGITYSPAAVSATESLFHAFSSSCTAWNVQELWNSTEQQESVDAALTFCTGVSLACRLLDSGQPVEGELQLIIVCARIEKLILCRAPQVLMLLFQLYRRLTRTGHQMLIPIIFGQILNMTAVKLTEEDCTWPILNHFRHIEAQHSHTLIKTLLRLVADKDEEHLGIFHVQSLYSRVESSTNLEIKSDYKTAAEKLRALSQQVEDHFGEHDHRSINMAIYRSWHHYQNARYNEAEALSSECVERLNRSVVYSEDYKIRLKLNVMGCLSNSLFFQCKFLGARGVVSWIIDLCLRLGGVFKSTLIEYLWFLECLNRTSGEFEAAEKTRARRLEIMNQLQVLV